MAAAPFVPHPVHTRGHALQAAFDDTEKSPRRVVSLSDTVIVIVTGITRC